MQEFSSWLVQTAVATRDWIEHNRETIVLVLKIGATVAAAGAGMMLLSKVILGVSAALGALKVAILLTSKVAMLLYANPVLLGLAAVAAAVVVITVAMQRAEAAARAKQRALEQASNAARRDHETGQQMRAADIDRMKRLEKLAEHQQRFGSLTQTQTEEATGLVGALNSRYEGLGLTFDETTGKVGGLSGAMDKMVSAMQDIAKLELQQQMREIGKEVEGLTAEADRAAKKWVSMAGRMAGYQDPAEEQAEILKRRNKLAMEQIDLQRQLRRIERGEEQAPVTADATGSDLDTIEALAKHREDVEKRLAAAALARIDDTQTRELTAAKSKYQEERDALDDLFKDDQEFELALADLKKATEAELDNIRARHRKQREAEEQRAAEQTFEAHRRYAEQQAAEEKRRAQQVGREAEDLQKQIARQTVEMKLADDPDAQRRALMELEHKWQMEAIAARKDLTEEERKNMREMQEHLHGLQMEALEPRKGAAGRPAGMGDITGHSAARAAAIAYGTTQGPQEKMAAGIDKMAEKLDDIADAAQDQTEAVREWSAAIQQWLAGLSYG